MGQRSLSRIISRLKKLKMKYFFTDHLSFYKKEIDEHRLSQSKNQIIYTKKIMGANAICSQDFSGIYWCFKINLYGKFDYGSICQLSCENIE